jgi:hypothetical protein
MFFLPIFSFFNGDLPQKLDSADGCPIKAILRFHSALNNKTPAEVYSGRKI